MAKKETIHDNAVMKEALKYVGSFSNLSPDAKKVVNNAIQNCQSIGKYKLPVEDVIYIVRNADVLSCDEVEKQLTAAKAHLFKKAATSKSSIDKYKKACTHVAKALEQYIADEGELNGVKAALKKAKSQRIMSNEQKQMLLDLIEADATIEEIQAFAKRLS